MPFGCVSKFYPAAVVAFAPLSSAAEPVDFRKQIYPLLHDRCFRCHDDCHKAKDGSVISADCEYCHK